MLFEQCWTVICWVASVTVISIHGRWFSLPVHRTQPEITKATGFRPGFSLLVRDVSQPSREVRELETRSHGVGSVFSQPMRDVSDPETRSSRLGFEFFCCRDHLPLCKCSVTHGHDMSVTRAQKQRDYYDLLHFLQNIRCAPTWRLEGC